MSNPNEPVHMYFKNSFVGNSYVAAALNEIMERVLQLEAENVKLRGEISNLKADAERVHKTQAITDSLHNEALIKLAQELGETK